MAAGEPETKIPRLEEERDPIFDQFRNDEDQMQLLECALLALTKGVGTNLKLCMKKVVCDDANADVSFSSATVRTDNYRTILTKRNCGIAAGIIFLDGMLVLNNFFHYGQLPKSNTIKMILAKLLKFLSESGEC